MSKLPKRLLVAGLLAGLGCAAMAQGTPPAPQPGARAPMEHRHAGDPAKMREEMAKRHADRVFDRLAILKARLKITPAQESAWSAYASAMQPPAKPAAHPSREEIAKLTTPQRIDRMQAMKAERDARFTQRANATKTFYAALTPEQQKVFDERAMRHEQGHRFHGGPDGHGGPGGPRGFGGQPPMKG